MDGKLTQLPWEALQNTEGDIPWEALYKFAAAVVSDPEVVDELVIMKWRQTTSKSYVVE